MPPLHNPYSSLTLRGDVCSIPVAYLSNSSLPMQSKQEENPHPHKSATVTTLAL